jgi:hypothetical protein
VKPTIDDSVEATVRQWSSLEFERLRHARRGRPVRSDNNPSVLPAIKMLIGDWYVDELGILTREITARD